MLTFAFCTYNRAERLEKLVSAMREQRCSIPFEILAVNNNSQDHTTEVLSDLASRPGARLRWVTEPVQGIVAARNRAIQESLDSEVMVFIDDDEIPMPGLLEAAVRAIRDDGAECVGGRVEVDFSAHGRPRWLGDELLGFLAEVDYGMDSFWINDVTTPIWTANIAYDMVLFRDDPSLRFDQRYDRKGAVIGGGSDLILFKELLKRGVRIRYCPQMMVKHGVEEWRLKRNYFLRLHYRAGLREGEYDTPRFNRHFLGVPPFLVSHFFRQSAKAIAMLISQRQGALRQSMNAAHSLGVLRGYGRRPFRSMHKQESND
jgi:glycosyltransferase involved in cell wall biosynthesis